MSALDARRLSRSCSVRVCAVAWALGACSGRAQSTERAASDPSFAWGPQSTVSGPFANDPVWSAPTITALPTTGSNAPLIRGGDLSNRARDRGSSERASPTQPVPEEPLNEEQHGHRDDPSEDQTAAGGPSRDALLDGLIGEWTDGLRRNDRAGNGYEEHECVLTIRGPTDAREVCTSTTFYGSAMDECGERGRTRVRITASPYTLSVQGASVRFTPGVAELVLDDLGRCRDRPAGSHTTMTTIRWSGSGDEFEVSNQLANGTTSENSVYRRRTRSGQRRR